MTSIQYPNILITGTPGTGKTTLCSLLKEKIPSLHIINVGDLVKQNELHEGYDNDYQTYILDEDKLLDHLEPILENGNNIIDFHTCEIFPERWFDLIIVLRCSTESLYSRLQERRYNQKKIDENMECEIMQVVLQSARESYDANVIQELPSDSTEDMENNAARIAAWYESWIRDNNN